jgi:NhaP-type Na+/H+ or K+/H+ antiporter
MSTLSTEAFVSTLALVGSVIVIAALISGLIERVALPQVAVFLALGAALGPSGLGLLDVTLDSPILRVVATLSLTLVLFTDAVSLNIAEIRRHGTLALLVLGPGTMLTAAMVAVAAWWLLDLPPAGAAILGAALASTDPVLLRGLLRRRDIPGPARQALRLESGLNDAVLLPVVLVAMAFAGAGSSDASPNWARLGIDLFLLGPGAGVAVGLAAVAMLDLVRRRVGVRRDYESIYSLGIAFTAYAAAEAVHGSGFLAAFAAGLTIAAFDVELCDCFLEYGETTAEMALLFTFVLFGSSLIWSGFAMASGAAVLFTLLVLLVRPIAFLASLARTNLDRRSRALIAWFGPRGLSSLLLVLLPVFAGQPGSDRLFAICCLVVLVSVVLHGGTPMFLSRGARRAAPAPVPGRGLRPPGEDGQGDGLSPDGEMAGTAAREPGATSERITLEELRRLQQSGAPVIVLDARSDRTYDGSDLQARGAVRLPPEHVIEQAAALRLPHDAWLVAFCA